MKLSEAELFEFYDLLDAVIIEARRCRSAYLPEKDSPELFLIRKILNEKIEREVRAFFAIHGPDFNETIGFNDWLSHAQRYVRTAILGDIPERIDRRREIELYFKRRDYHDRHLVLNNLDILSRRDSYLGQYGPHKKDPDIVYRTPEHLSECARLRTQFDPDNIFDGLGLEKLSKEKDEGPFRIMFVIPDLEAQRAAFSMACEKKTIKTKDGKAYYDEPTGYIPGYIAPELRELMDSRRWADKLIEEHEQGEYPEIPRDEFVPWLEKNFLSCPLADLPSMDELKRRASETKPNIDLYLFSRRDRSGFVLHRGKLFRRLRDYHRVLLNQAAGEIPIEESFPDPEGEEEILQKIERNEERSLFRNEIMSLLTPRQREIYQEVFERGIPVIEVAQKFDISPQAVYKVRDLIISKVKTRFGIEIRISDLEMDKHIFEKSEPTKFKRPDGDSLQCPFCEIFFRPTEYKRDEIMECPFCHKEITH